jgi:hypothetical protein
MTQNPPQGMPRITAYLLYEDVDAAVPSAGVGRPIRDVGPDGIPGG